MNIFDQHDKFLGQNVFCFNEEDNGGESLILQTQYFDNGDGPDGVYGVQQLTLGSYGNSATFNLGTDMLNPETLRRLADQLDAVLYTARHLVKD